MIMTPIVAVEDKIKVQPFLLIYPKTGGVCHKYRIQNLDSYH